MADSVRLARDFPGVTFVLLHAGMLADRTRDGWTRWREGMRSLAACPNVCVKLSGLGTFEHRCNAELWRPVIEETLALFGPDRAMFGSNFPVEKLWTSYPEVVHAVAAGLEGLGPRERAAVWHDTAARVYRLG
jgi:predicted TIM-barrel fold metal-dependent hydrolase